MSIRLLTLLFTTGWLACSSPALPELSRKYTSQLPDAYRVAILIMDGTYNTEFTAPYDIFQHTRFREGIKPMEVFTVAKSHQPITTFEGIHIEPDYSYLSDSLPAIDVLVIPSAEHHLDSDRADSTLIQWVRQVSKKAQFITSHCDGAFILAQAGVLDGHVCTTFPGDIGLMRAEFPKLDIRDSVYFVHDDRVITSAGGARSFEAALYLCDLLYGVNVARRIADGLVIDWNLSQIPHLVVLPNKTTF
ncbi:MAG: DJ-1/PfpI family protein [Saprospiraceae bacterium]|nr:DJ-1/PfpI family protein [Saprospiraceae bacterium]HPG06908.1 DJ-1/PfpI family protein [Saprospiraceae bacterium]